MTTEAVQTQAPPERGMRMLHIQHPERPGEAWCGADVLGVVGYFGKVECVVCVDLRRARDRGEPGS